MDYWERVAWKYWDTYEKLRAAVPSDASFYFVETDGARAYTQPRYKWGDYLVFGRETAGLPKKLLEANKDSTISIPMFHPHARSINLATAVAIVLYEAIRQVKGF